MNRFVVFGSMIFGCLGFLVDLDLMVGSNHLFFLISFKSLDFPALAGLLLYKARNPVFMGEYTGEIGHYPQESMKLLHRLPLLHPHAQDSGPILICHISAITVF